MAKLKDFQLMDQIKHYNSLGMTDGKIAKLLDKRVNVIHYYRHYVMGLKATREKKNYRGDIVAKTKGYILRGIKSSAKRRNLDFNLTIDDLNLISKCPLLDIDLNYKSFTDSTESNADNHATVDRIDNSKGYVKGNVWIISRLANNMKNKASIDQLKTFCKNLLTRI